MTSANVRCPHCNAVNWARTKTQTVTWADTLTSRELNADSVATNEVVDARIWECLACQFTVALDTPLNSAIEIAFSENLL